jgi:hypothetical protein
LGGGEFKTQTKERDLDQCIMAIDTLMVIGVRELLPNSEMKTYFKIDVKGQMYLMTNNTRRESLLSCETIPTRQ